jgi:aminomethyltransferase
VGRVCSTAWSPFQRCGVAIVRLDDPELGPGAEVEVACDDGQARPAEICELPMYDRERRIPRGELVDIPELPEAGDG